MQEILGGADVQGLTRQAAEGIASEIVSSHHPQNISIDNYQAHPGHRITDGRQLISVTVLDPRARLWQAQDGMLTRAAAAQGLEVQAVILYTTRAGKTRRATAAQVKHWTRGSRK